MHLVRDDDHASQRTIEDELQGQLSVSTNSCDFLVKDWLPRVVVDKDAIALCELRELSEPATKLRHLSHVDLQSLTDPSPLSLWRSICWHVAKSCEAVGGICAHKILNLLICDVLPDLPAVGLHVAIHAVGATLPNQPLNRHRKSETRVVAPEVAPAGGSNCLMMACGRIVASHDAPLTADVESHVCVAASKHVEPRSPLIELVVVQAHPASNRAVFVPSPIQDAFLV